MGSPVPSECLGRERGASILFWVCEQCLSMLSHLVSAENVDPVSAREVSLGRDTRLLVCST